MILIISNHSGEYTTDCVIDWIDHKGFNFKRLNGVDLLNKPLNLTVGQDSSIGIPDIDPSDITVVWYRRWLPYNFYLNKYSDLTERVYLNIELTRKLNQEISILKKYLFNQLKSKPWLSNFSKISLNKLEVLYEAKKNGIKIPSTIVTNTKADLIKFKEEHREVIFKSISETIALSTDNNSFVSYTSLLDNEMIEKLDDHFFPSLLQEAIDKLYELRIFYLDGEFYSMAIFSQADSQTEVDFRAYNFETPNRNVPFKLPKKIETKLTKLMKSLGLNTGSIDMIRNLKGEYIFLEINPVGQFGMTSTPCNYHLEEKVANYLIQHD